MKRLWLIGILLSLAAFLQGAVERQGNSAVFTLRAENAQEVLVTGSWCGWIHPGSVPDERLEPLRLKRDANGLWRLRIRNFPHTSQQYRFLVDGKWISDPDNELSVENEFETVNSIVPARESLGAVWPPLPEGTASLRVVVTDGLRGVRLGRCFVLLQGADTRHVTTTNPDGELDVSGLPAGGYTVMACRTAYQSSEPVTLRIPEDGVREVALDLMPATGTMLNAYFWAYSPRRQFASGPIQQVQMIGEFNRWGTDGGPVSLTDLDGDGLYSSQFEVHRTVIESDYLFSVQWTDDEGVAQWTSGSDPDGDFATPEIAADSHFRRFRPDRPIVSIDQIKTVGRSADVEFSIVRPRQALSGEVTVNGVTTPFLAKDLEPVPNRPGFFRRIVSGLQDGESSILIRVFETQQISGSDAATVWIEPDPPADPEAWRQRWTDASGSMVSGPPTWLGDAAIYQVYVRSFSYSDDDGIGDFNGLRARLDYIQDLGFNTILLMPIWDGPSEHGYTPTSLWRVEQDYGTDQDFRDLVAAAHRHGLRIILDYNDTATFTGHPIMGSAVREPDHPLRDWIYWIGPNQYQSYTLTQNVTNGGWPQFNYHNPEVSSFG